MWLSGNLQLDTADRYLTTKNTKRHEDKHKIILVFHFVPFVRFVVESA